MTGNPIVAVARWRNIGCLSSVLHSYPLDSLKDFVKLQRYQSTVTAKMAEVELKDVPCKELPTDSPVTPNSEEKNLVKNEPYEVGSSATTPTTESSVKSMDTSPGLLTPNPVKMPQASAMKRPDPLQNGGEAFVNRDGTVAEAPRMKKVRGLWQDVFSDTLVVFLGCLVPTSRTLQWKLRELPGKPCIV